MALFAREICMAEGIFICSEPDNLPFICVMICLAASTSRSYIYCYLRGMAMFYLTLNWLRDESAIIADIALCPEQWALLFMMNGCV